MTLTVFNAAPIPALASLWQTVQAPTIALATVTPLISQIQGSLEEPAALGMNPAEAAPVRTALQNLERTAARFGRETGQVSRFDLQPSLALLAGALPARFRALDDITDEYAIMGRMGSGGLSTVFHGHDLTNGRLVAIKVVEIPEDLPADISPQTVEDALRREYELLRSLRPGTGPEVMRMGMMNGKLCMVMELLGGEDLLHWRDGFFHRFQTSENLNELLVVARQVVGELADLHEQGIVHCDVKPENFKYTELTRTRSRCARVFDLGIACREGERHPFIMGTPDYMSPESWNPQNANGFGRDVFALGVTLYWLLTGKLPFEGETPEATARNAMTVTPEPPSEVLLRERPDLIDAFSMNDIGKLEMLDQIIMRALNRDEGVRFYDAGEMLAELERGFRDHEVVVVADRRRVRRISVG